MWRCSVSVDGGKWPMGLGLSGHAIGGGRFGYCDLASARYSMKGLEPGRHKIEFVVYQSLLTPEQQEQSQSILWQAPVGGGRKRYGGYGDDYLTPVLKADESVPPFFARTAAFEAEFELLPPDAPDPIRRVEDPAIEGWLRNAVKVNWLYKQKGQMNNDTGWEMTANVEVHADPPPIDLAMRVYVLDDDKKETRIGEAVWRRELWGTPPASSGTGNQFSWPVPAVYEPQNLTFIFQGSVDVVVNTTDLYEVWDGEAVIGPVQPKRPLWAGTDE